MRGIIELKALIHIRMIIQAFFLICVGRVVGMIVIKVAELPEMAFEAAVKVFIAPAYGFGNECSRENIAHDENAGYISCFRIDSTDVEQ